MEWWLLLSGLLVVASTAIAWGRGKRRLPERLDEPISDTEKRRRPHAPRPPSWPYRQEKEEHPRDDLADAEQGWTWIRRKKNPLLTRAVLRSMLRSERSELQHLAVDHLLAQGHEDAVELLGEGLLLGGGARLAEAFLDQLAEEDMGYAAHLLRLYDALARGSDPRAPNLLIEAVDRRLEAHARGASEALLTQVWGDRLDRLDALGRAALASALRSLLSPEPEPLDLHLDALANDEWVRAFIWRMAWAATGPVQANLQMVLNALHGAPSDAQGDLPDESHAPSAIKPASLQASSVILAARHRTDATMERVEWSALMKAERSDPGWLVAVLTPAPHPSAKRVQAALGLRSSPELSRGAILDALWWGEAAPCECDSGAAQLRLAESGVYYNEPKSALWCAALLVASPLVLERWLAEARQPYGMMERIGAAIVEAIPRASMPRAQKLLAAICRDERPEFMNVLLELYDEREPLAHRALFGMQLLAGRNQEVVEGVLQRLESEESSVAIHMLFSACLLAARLENPGRLPLLYAHLDEVSPSGRAQLALLDRMPRGTALVATLEVMRRPFQGAISAVSDLHKDRANPKDVRKAAGEAKRRLSEALERGSLSLVQDDAQGALSQLNAGALSESKDAP